MKSIRRESHGSPLIGEDSKHYILTLDPTKRDHRVIALIVDYTSNPGECGYYKPTDEQRQCSIAPRFKIVKRDCRGKCFVNGFTCQVILDCIEELKDPKNINGNHR